MKPSVPWHSTRVLQRSQSGNKSPLRTSGEIFDPLPFVNEDAAGGVHRVGVSLADQPAGEVHLVDGVGEEITAGEVPLE
jgi:hypothetical protein